MPSGLRRKQVVALFVGEMILPLLGGLALGFSGVYGISTLLRQQGLLFEVRRFEPALYAGVTLAFFVCAVVAAWIPARRAALIEPMAALRAD